LPSTSYKYNFNSDPLLFNFLCRVGQLDIFLLISSPNIICDLKTIQSTYKDYMHE
jgi:hypothetical protein